MDFIDSVLADQSKFHQLPPTTDLYKLSTQQEDACNRFLTSLKKNNTITPEQYRSLHSAGKAVGIMYGLPKVHKNNLPLRPILTAFNTTSYKLAKYLVTLLEPLTTNQYTLPNSYSFCQYLQSLSTSQPLHMASYDITSLFTNIPLNETIDIICNIIFRDSQSYHNFTKETLRKALQLTCTNTPFLFNKQIFRQTDGVAMGSPLGPTLANIFLCHHESQWLTNCPSQFTPLVYKRYVDDTFTAFSDPSHYNLFLNYLNSKHPNIKFTLEPASNQTIPFLDCLVTHTNSFKTQVYRKPTFTGLAINFNSFIYSKFKINSIRTLIHRAYHVSSTFSLFNKEISFLRDLYKNNGYPAHLLDKYVKLFLNNIFSPKTPIPTVPKRKFYISLPFYGSISETAYLHLFRTLSSHFTHLNFQPVPKTSTTIGSFFRSKDRVPDELQADVIYQYTCGGCKSAYVGSTHRRSLERFSEHLGISHRTKKPLNSPPFSHIRNHGYNNNHPISLRSFKIIDSASPSNLAISESLHILKINPSINVQTTAAPLHIANSSGLLH